MRLRDIAFENLKRRKGKTFFIILGLLVAVSTVVTLVTVTEKMGESLGRKLDEYGANIIVIPKSDGLTLSYGGIALGEMSLEKKEMDEAVLDKIRNIENSRNISIIAPKIIGVVNFAGINVPIAGIDFEEELRLKRWWRKASPNYKAPMPEHDMDMEGTSADIPQNNGEPVILSDMRVENAAIIGYEAARKLGISPGEDIPGKDFRLYSSVVLEETGSQDDMMIFTSLPFAQKILGKDGKISLIEISAYCYNCPIEDIVSQISGILPQARVTALKEVVRGRIETLDHFRNFAAGISGVVILVGTLLVFVTMMGSVNERKREIGIFRAIGFQQKSIMHIFLIEAVTVGAIAGIIGYAAGIGAAYIVMTALKDFSGGGISFNPYLALSSVGLSIVAGILASYYPARKASRLDPSAALRSL
ncbi:MAG: ABC transporter permease [Candidatus Schekmanbacteria bacterium]|nr:ABC transporter permease [Candidatus Schekmanbacteria bacterium]